VTVARGIVGADGRSVTPDGVYDMAAAGADLILDEDIEQKLSELFKDLKDGGETGLKAKFKLEVAFSEHRSFHQPFTGIVSAWTNGGFLHGGGDEVVYFCGQKLPVEGGSGGHKTCATPLALAFVGKRVAVCPTCKQPSKPEDLVGQVIAKLPMQHWASLLVRMMGHLEYNADIRMGTLIGDLRVANEEEGEKERRGESLNKVRRQRAWIAYPLKNIIKDTSAGATLASRLRSFLTA
jgi:hypothetical protein